MDAVSEEPTGQGKIERSERVEFLGGVTNNSDEDLAIVSFAAARHRLPPGPDFLL